MNKDFGYHLLNTQEAEKQALVQAFDVVRRARQAGVEMRTWAQRVNWETKALLHRIKKETVMSNEMRLFELSSWESKIVEALRTYMNGSSNLLNDLRPLNPPLKSEQIKQFADAITSDRNVTVDSLEPLTKTIAELTAFKLSLNHHGQNGHFDYRPT